MKLVLSKTKYIVLKIKAKIADITVAMAKLFNAKIWEKNHISLSSLSGQSTCGKNQ
jgi:hypothetical protein